MFLSALKTIGKDMNASINNVPSGGGGGLVDGGEGDLSLYNMYLSALSTS